MIKRPPKIMLDPAMCEAFLFISREKAGDLIRAVVNYHKSGEEPDLSDDLKPYFAQFKESIRINSEHYQSTSIKNSENGKKGGAPKGNKNAKKQAVFSTENASFNIKEVEKDSLFSD